MPSISSGNNLARVAPSKVPYEKPRFVSFWCLSLLRLLTPVSEFSITNHLGDLFDVTGSLCGADESTSSLIWWNLVAAAPVGIAKLSFASVELESVLEEVRIREVLAWVARRRWVAVIIDVELLLMSTDR